MVFIPEVVGDKSGMNPLWPWSDSHSDVFQGEQSPPDKHARGHKNLTLAYIAMSSSITRYKSVASIVPRSPDLMRLRRAPCPSSSDMAPSTGSFACGARHEKDALHGDDGRSRAEIEMVAGAGDQQLGPSHAGRPSWRVALLISSADVHWTSGPSPPTLNYGLVAHRPWCHTLLCLRRRSLLASSSRNGPRLASLRSATRDYAASRTIFTTVTKPSL